MAAIFGKGSLINLNMIETQGPGPIKMGISLGTSDLPTSVLLDFANNPPLLQAWVDLFYKCMEELWSPDSLVKISGVLESGAEALEPAKLVATNRSILEQAAQQEGNGEGKEHKSNL